MPTKVLNDATEKDLHNYAAACEAAKKGSSKIKFRGIALYFGFMNNKKMASLAAEIREAGTSKDRVAFKLKDFLWVNQTHVANLKSIGITNINQMIEIGRTPEARKKLSSKAGIAADDILELVKLSNLARLSAVKGVRARLYHDSGLDIWEKIALLDAEKLRDVCIRFIEKTGFPGIPPTLKEADYTVESAKTLPRVVEW